MNETQRNFRKEMDKASREGKLPSSYEARRPRGSADGNKGGGSGWGWLLTAGFIIVPLIINHKPTSSTMPLSPPLPTFSTNQSLVTPSILKGKRGVGNYEELGGVLAMHKELTLEINDIINNLIHQPATYQDTYMQGDLMNLGKRRLDLNKFSSSGVIDIVALHKEIIDKVERLILNYGNGYEGKEQEANNELTLIHRDTQLVREIVINTLDKNNIQYSIGEDGTIWYTITN